MYTQQLPPASQYLSSTAMNSTTSSTRNNSRSSKEDTSDMLDTFCSNSNRNRNRNRRWDVPPALQAVSCSDSASVGSDHHGYNAPQYFQQQQQQQQQRQYYQTRQVHCQQALVPYDATEATSSSQGQGQGQGWGRGRGRGRGRGQTPPTAAACTTTTALTTTTTTTTTKSSLRDRKLMMRVPISENPLGTDSVHPRKKSMKKQRKRKTVAGAVGGMVVGGLTLGPVGVFIGAAAGAMASNKICKARERRLQRKYEQANFQTAAWHSKSIQQATFA